MFVQFAGKLYQGNGSTETPQKTGEKKDEINDTPKDYVEKGDGEKSGSNGEGSKEIMTRTRRKSEEKKKVDRSGLSEAIGGEDIRCNSLWKNPQVGVKLSREVAEAVDKIDWEGVEEVG